MLDFFWKKKLIKWVEAEIKDLRKWRDMWRNREGCEYQYNSCESSINTLLGILYILQKNKTPYHDKHGIYKKDN